MRSDVPERLLRSAGEIRELGSGRTTRLTIIKGCFQDKRRLRALGMLIASRVANRKIKGPRGAADLYLSARALLGVHPRPRSVVPRRAAQQLHENLRTFQSEHKKTPWGIVRVLKNHDLFLIEAALGLLLRRTVSPADGYRLVAAFCQHHDSRRVPERP